ncbi:MAG: PVC-type heme-binding CxxCH protein [Gemmataceae bacterium]
MKRLFLGLLALLTFACDWSFTQTGGPKNLKFQQSPPKPAPEWFKAIDQGKTDPRLKGYFTPEGLKVEIVAEAPEVINPVGMTFGPDGTLYVLEWLKWKGGNFPASSVTFTYKDGSKRNVAIMKKPIPDQVKVLKDTNSDGQYDQAKVVLKDELPSSILVHDGYVYLTGQGTVRRYKQEAPEGPYGKKEVIAQGFCGFHHHQVSGLTIGNDGWLYITSGDDDNFVEGSDGAKVNVLRTGAVFRCRPDGRQMHEFARGFRNPYRNVAFDTKFHMFHVDNDNEDGSKWTGCRLMHIPEAVDYGWRLRPGARCCRPDFTRSAVYGELPGKLPPMLKTGRGSPAGLLIYNDTYFPEHYRGVLYYPDVFRKLIRAYVVEQNGATFRVTHEFEFMKSNDPLFRPCQMVLGPDGAMYICDWRTDSGGAGKLWGNGTKGRIYRVSWAGTEKHPAIPLRATDSWAKIAKQSDEDLLQTLESNNFSDRVKAQAQLRKRGEKNRDTLLTITTNVEKPLHTRIAAIGVVQSFWNDEVSKTFQKLLLDLDPDIRRLAAEGLGLNSQKADQKVHAALNRALNEREPEVLRAIALAIGRIGAKGAADALVNVLKFDQGKDIFLRDGIVRSVERLGKQGMQSLDALANSGNDTHLGTVVEAFLSFRTRPAAEALPNLLHNVHLNGDQRAQLLESYTNYQLDPQISVEPVVSYLMKADMLARMSTNPVKNLAGLDKLKLAGLKVMAATKAFDSPKAHKLLVRFLDDEPSLNVRLAAIEAIANGRVEKAAPALVKALAVSGLKNGERSALIKAVGILKVKKATQLLRELIEEKALASSNEGREVQAQALRSLSMVDSFVAAKLAAKVLEQANFPLQKEAITVLGTRPRGAILVGKTFLQGKLPRALLPQVTEVLRRFSKQNKAVTPLLKRVMKSGLLNVTPENLKSIRKLVRDRGNPIRGRKLYLSDTKIACISCHQLEGVGGNVGPDLTRSWDTQSTEKIIEHLLEPSKEIKEGFQSYMALTKKGQIFTGLKISQTPDEVVLRDPNAKEIRIATQDLKAIKPSTKSLMPDDVVKHLTFGQFLDLVAFLKNRKAQEDIRGMGLEFWVVGPFGPDWTVSHPPEKNPALDAEYTVGKQKFAWQVLRADPNGSMNLQERFREKNFSAYATTFVFSPEAQKVQMLCGSAGPIRVWINKEKVHEDQTPSSSKQPSKRVAVDLSKGWNQILIRVGTTNGRFSLRFAGEGLRLAVRTSTKESS